MTENETPETPEVTEDETTATAQAEAVETPDPEVEHDHDHEHGHGHKHDHDEEDEAFELVEDPVFDVTYKGDCAYDVKITIPPANEAKATGDLFDKVSHEAELPGFRRGRAPRKLIEKKLSKYVRKEAQDKVVEAAFKKLVEDKKLHPIGGLKTEGLENAAEHPEGTPLEFTISFEVAPRVELGKYRGLEIERPVLKVEDADVDEALKEMQGRLSIFETVEGAAAADGSQVIIDFHGAIDGQDFGGNKANDYPYILGTKRFFAEFDAALQGAKADDTKTCEVTFPESHANEQLKGKTAVFTITVKEVKQKNTPEMNDDFAKQSGYENLAAMREGIMNRLRAQMMAQSNSIAASRALDQVVATSTFEFPKTVVESMTESDLEEAIKKLRQERKPESEIREQEPALREKAKEGVLRSLRFVTVLNEIADAEGLEVTDADLEQEAAQIGRRYGLATEQVAAFINEGGQRGNYELRILHDKATSLLLEHAVITDKEVAREEIEKTAEESESTDGTEGD